MWRWRRAGRQRCPSGVQEFGCGVASAEVEGPRCQLGGAKANRDSTSWSQAKFLERLWGHLQLWLPSKGAMLGSTPSTQVARGREVLPGHCGRVKYATLCFQDQARIPIQHGSVMGTSSPVTSSHSTVTQGRDIFTDVLPLQMSPNLLDGAASPGQPAGCRPSAGPEHHPSCLVQWSHSPAQRAMPRSDWLFPSSFQSIVAPLVPRRHHGLPHFPASGCTSHPVLLFTEVTKRLPRIISGEMNVLASSQVMAKHLISTIPPHSHPPGSLEASPTSMSSNHLAAGI